MNTKLFFFENERNLGTFEKLCPYIRISYKYVLKSVKSLDWIFGVIEYSCKPLECQISFKNTKPFFLENEANL